MILTGPSKPAGTRESPAEAEGVSVKVIFFAPGWASPMSLLTHTLATLISR